MAVLGLPDDNPQDDRTVTTTTTEWGVRWFPDSYPSATVEPRADEQDARRIAAMYRGDAEVVSSTVTVTRTPWGPPRPGRRRRAGATTPPWTTVSRK